MFNFNKNLPNRIREGNIKLVKMRRFNEKGILNKLLVLYNSNLDHLYYWHHNIKELMFQSIIQLKWYFNLSCSTCYAVYNDGKIAGFIEVGNIYLGKGCEKYCSLTFLLDKDNSNKGIMRKCLMKLEKIFIDHGIDVLTASVDVENIPSLKLMSKLNFEVKSMDSMLLDDMVNRCFYYKLQKKIRTNKIETPVFINQSFELEKCA